MRAERGLRKVWRKRLHAHLSACACAARKATEGSEITRSVRGRELDLTLQFHGGAVAARPGDNDTWAHASSGSRAGTSGALEIEGSVPLQCAAFCVTDFGRSKCERRGVEWRCSFGLRACVLPMRCYYLLYTA